jgi:hypothetical protein
VVDIPRVIAKVVEFRLHSLFCEHCNITTRASLRALVVVVATESMRHAMSSAFERA